MKVYMYVLRVRVTMTLPCKIIDASLQGSDSYLPYPAKTEAIESEIKDKICMKLNYCGGFRTTFSR